MFKQIAIAFGLAVVTGSAFAAGSMTGNTASGGSTTSAAAIFHKLDINGDGVLTQSEANADPAVARLYDSMDTAASIKTDPKAKATDGSATGVTLDQFEAGMQAASGGAAGPAVSGGETYTVMKDGTRQQASNTMSHAENSMSRSMNDAQHQMRRAQNGMSQTESTMQQRSNTMSTPMQNGMSNTAEPAGPRMGNGMSGMQNDTSTPMSSNTALSHNDMSLSQNRMSNGQ